jgi:hypothetical protein
MKITKKTQAVVNLFIYNKKQLNMEDSLKVVTIIIVINVILIKWLPITKFNKIIFNKFLRILLFQTLKRAKFKIKIYPQCIVIIKTVKIVYLDSNCSNNRNKIKTLYLMCLQIFSRGNSRRKKKWWTMHLRMLKVNICKIINNSKINKKMLVRLMRICLKFRVN